MSHNTNALSYGVNATIATGPSGVVSVAWLSIADQQPQRIMFNQCPLGSSCSGTDRVLATINHPLDDHLPGLSFKVRSGPQIAIFTRDSSLQIFGYIYVVWAAKRDSGASTDTDIYMTASNDGGATFRCPIFGSTASTCAIAATPEDEFFPAISIDKQNFINVVYYRRTSQSASTFNVYMITSGIAGENWSTPIRINSGPDIVPVDDSFIGDYIGIDSDSHQNIRPAWMDSRDGNQDIYTAKVSGC